MKLLILSLIALSASLLCDAATPQETRDNLLRRARFLTTLLEGEIKLLRFEGHDLSAQGLERELEQLITLEVDLRATEVMNVTDAAISRLDTRLNDLETRIQSQLEALGKQFVSRQEIELILRRTRDIIDLVADAVKQLKQQNRSLEARGLEEEQIRIVELEILIRSTQVPNELRRLEELLIQADYRVWELLGSLGATRKKRDLKDDVIARANELIVLANDAIKALNTTGNRSASIELIREVEQRIVRIENELKNATNATVIARLEEDLIYEEFRLVSDLARVGRPVTLNETRLLMLTTAEYLWSRANRTIEELKKEGNRTADVSAIEAEERQIAQLVGLVRNATNERELAQLEISLGEAEYRLYELLSRLGRNPADPAEIRRVLRRAEDLAVRVVIEIRALFQANRSLEAEGLLEEEQALLRLDVEIRDAVTIAELRALEERLQRVEDRIIEQLFRLGRLDRLGRLIDDPRPAPTKRDLKTDVLKRAQELIAIANDAISFFVSQNRTQAVNLIQNAVRQLNASVAELQALNTNNATQLGILEGRVLELEFQLAEDLRRFNRPIDANERRDLLITAADGLLQYATARINQLKAQNRSLAIQRVEAEEQRIKNIVDELKNATSTQQLDRLENELDAAERRFYEELNALGEPVINFEEIQNLTRRAEDLAVRIVIAVRKLFEQGKVLLAEGLQEEERTLIHLDAQLRSATTPTQISQFAKILAIAETRVEDELKQLGL